MPGQRPQIVEIYRIVHIDNVEYLLTHGMFTRHHAQADPNYTNIGDKLLISQRDTHPVSINPPNGVLGEYIPFYFGPLSPMLLNIKTGHRGITKISQSKIIYIVCQLDDVLAECNEWCFTNGHARDRLTNFYNDVADLDEVYWDVVSLRYWKPIVGFMDRQSRKEAEFLIKNHVPINCVYSIVVYDQQSKTTVEETVNRLGLTIPVVVDTSYYYYE